MDYQKRKIHNLEELKIFSKDIVQEIKKPQLLLMQGPLGVGKTQCVHFINECFGVSKKDICSPSFSIINTYKSPKSIISHIDFFRLQDKQDLESTGIWDVFLDSQIVFIEWADLFQVQWPDHWNKLFLFFEFSKEEEDVRWIKWGSC